MLNSLDGRFARFALLIAAVLVLSPATAWAEDPATPAPDTPTEEKVEEKKDESPIHWERDIEKAKARAKTEGKDLLINFTGSDWCHWCIKLEEEVFSKAEFGPEAEKKFVFLFLDFPRSEELRAKVVDAQAAQELKTKLGVQGFPSIIHTSADGTLLGRTGYQTGGPASYLAHLNQMHANGAHIKALNAKRETITAPALKQGIEALLGNGMLEESDFEWVFAKARELDPEGKHGVRIHADRRDEATAFKAVLPKSPNEEPDLAAIYEFVKDAKYLANNRMYVGASLHIIEKYLKAEKRFDDAIALAKRLKGMEPLNNREDVRTHIEEVIETLVKAKADAATEEGSGKMEDDSDTEEDEAK